MFVIKIDGVCVLEKENKKANIFKDVKVFGGDKFYNPVDGKIRNLRVDPAKGTYECEVKVAVKDGKGKNM